MGLALPAECGAELVSPGTFPEVVGLTDNLVEDFEFLILKRLV